MKGCSGARRAQLSRDHGLGSAVVLLQMDEELADLVEFIKFPEATENQLKEKKKKGLSVFSG